MIKLPETPLEVKLQWRLVELQDALARYNKLTTEQLSLKPTTKEGE